MYRPLSPQGNGAPPEVRTEIRRLARQARQEDLRAEEELRERGERSRIYKLIRIGAALIALQAGLFAYLYMRYYDVAKAPTSVAPAPPKTCDAAVKRAYWKVVAYLADHGHPPSKLEDLVGSYVEQSPVDPVTGKPLVYSTDGDRFTIRCAGSAS